MTIRLIDRWWCEARTMIRWVDRWFGWDANVPPQRGSEDMTTKHGKPEQHHGTAKTAKPAAAKPSHTPILEDDAWEDPFEDAVSPRFPPTVPPSVPRNEAVEQRNDPPATVAGPADYPPGHPAAHSPNSPNPFAQNVAASAQNVATQPSAHDAELLAALKRLLDQPMAKPADMTPDEQAELWDAHHAARAVVAKAEGGA